MLRADRIGIVPGEINARQMEEFVQLIREMEVKKSSVFIHAARGRVREQQEAMMQFAKLAQEAREAQEREDVFAKTGLAAGFANGILRAGLITKDELAQLIDILDRAGSDRLKELDKKKISAFHRIFKGGGVL